MITVKIGEGIKICHGATCRIYRKYYRQNNLRL